MVPSEAGCRGQRRFPDAAVSIRQRVAGASPAMKFVVMVGIMSFFADFTYEGSRSIIGPYLGRPGAGAFAISVISGAGEFLGYGLRLFWGRGADRTGRYRPITIGGYVLQMSVVPLLALAGNWQVAALLIILERVGEATRSRRGTPCSRTPPRRSDTGGRFPGIHEALDQFGATFGPLLVALVLTVTRHDYKTRLRVAGRPGRDHAVAAGRRAGALPAAAGPGGRPAEVTTAGLPRVFWLYLAAAALAGAGFADFPLISCHFAEAGTVSAPLIPVFYAVAMAVSGTGSLVLGRIFDRAGIGILIPLTIVAAAYAPLVFLGGFWACLAGASLWGLGMGVQESIIPAAVAPMVSPDRRASAYGPGQDHADERARAPAHREWWELRSRAWLAAMTTEGQAAGRLMMCPAWRYALPNGRSGCCCRRPPPGRLRRACLRTQAGSPAQRAAH